MPEMQEFELQGPTMEHDRFHVQKESKLYQRWTWILAYGDDIEFYSEEHNTWMKAKVGFWPLDDGSGNAPGANGHYFAQWQDDGGKWKIDLYEGLKVRLEAPTDEELIACSGWCEGIDWGEYPDEHEHCHEKGKEYISKGGWHVWYCDKHKPDATYTEVKA